MEPARLQAGRSGAIGTSMRTSATRDAIEAVFRRYGGAIAVVIHTAAQPSHDWAAKEPLTDFAVNAIGTLNLLEATRRHAPKAVVHLHLHQQGLRRHAEPPAAGGTGNALGNRRRPPLASHGIPEEMSIDQSLHSLFGASKVAADVLVQEYGRYFGMQTACFRGGCLTGPAHSGAQLHGFLAYLMKCAVTGTPYTVFGYKGKQVRDNIHCARSGQRVLAILPARRAPARSTTSAAAGTRNCSMLEAIAICEELTGRPMNWHYSDDNRIGDHIWWISDVRKFQAHYPEWHYRYDLEGLIGDIHAALEDRAGEPVTAA